MPAASKPLGRPRDQVDFVEIDTSNKNNTRRGKRSNEARLERIEGRKVRRVESRRIYTYIYIYIYIYI